MHGKDTITLQILTENMAKEERQNISYAEELGIFSYRNNLNIKNKPSDNFERKKN